jgi:peptide/nickel transport system ATP-binding protein
MAADKLLQVNDLTVEISSHQQSLTILKRINFSVCKGETLALVGESGSGKSFTALAIMQLLPSPANILTSSSILLEGADLLTFSEIKMRSIRGKKIALIFQEAITALNPVMTVGHQLLEVIKNHFKLSHQEAYQRALALLEEVGIPTPRYYYKVYPHQLSGGLKQRAMIAIALAGEPDLLIADEPTTALDVTLQAQIISLLRKIQQKRGMGLIFITHDLGIVYEIADQVVVLYKGEVAESASATHFFKNPRDAYSRKLFASIPGWLSPLPKTTVNNPAILLEVKGLKVYYPIKKGIFKRTVDYVKAVDDVGFELPAGSTLALVGESGSGKTTTGMAILKLLHVTSGKIYFEGRDIVDLKGGELLKFRKDLQVVFQDPYGSMNPRMLVGEIIAEGLYSQGLTQNINHQIDELLHRVGLNPKSKQRYPHEFSGGQRQRICIARALAVQPKLLICDEPTSALDVSAQMQILQLLYKLQQDMGLSYLLITHNIAVVEYMADQVAVMHDGRIVEYGTTQEVLHHPQHLYTKKLLDAVPKIPQTFFDSQNETDKF